jgi:hypothetical protein
METAAKAAFSRGEEGAIDGTLAVDFALGHA